ncbi:diguanylate cyclase [Thauera sp.]|uniref:diguanylate cyclase domain-containing protein n=1 Tax=Thauera sp. TaxID=1905334 RepID=UPI002C0CDBD8|nr:diguanylate cyclase [Thauera sp.]HRO35715.1 diguanylate cyclase [Thauera sp.]
MESAPASGDAHPLRVVALIYLCGALLFGTLLALEWRLIDRTVAAIARERGAALFSLIETTREWNAMHGGVYVVVDGATQPNPWLQHPARDLQTSDGVRLTMVNPAYMTRQIADLALHADGARLHITSLKPIRPENLADDWEADALARFEAGEREVLALVEGAEEGRGPVHRYMAPLVVREPCLQCHAEQGYVLGDIRGGISVTMPAGVLIARRDQLRTRAVFIYVLAGLLAAGLVHGLLRANRRHVAQVRFINAEQERLIERRTGELAEANRRLAGEVELHRRSEQRLAASESRYRAIFDSAAEGIMLTDAALRIVQVNPAFSEITGYAAEEVLGRTPSMLGSGRHGEDFFRDLLATLVATGRWQGEVWNRRKDGDLYVQWMSAVRLGEADAPEGFVATMTDITSRKQSEERLRFRANHDALTGLPNRRLFEDRLQSAIASALRHGERFALMLVDLDRFKGVNDRFGHLAGDALLVEVGRRLQLCVRASDTVARLGGDEFAVILGEVGGRGDAAEVAGRICASMAEPFELGEGVAQVGASVGVALGPQDDADAEELQRRADAALYSVKHGGRGSFRFHGEPG